MLQSGIRIRQFGSHATGYLYRTLGILRFQRNQVHGIAIVIALLVQREHVTTYLEDSTHIISSIDQFSKLFSV